MDGDRWRNEQKYMCAHTYMQRHTKKKTLQQQSLQEGKMCLNIRAQIYIYMYIITYICKYIYKYIYLY